MAKACHLCPHLHLRHSKFDQRRWVIPSIAMAKLNDSPFSNLRIPLKANKAFGRYSHFFHSNFIKVVQHKCILQKCSSFTWLVKKETWWTYFVYYDRKFHWPSFETLIFTKLCSIVVKQGIKNGKVTLKYYKQIRNYKWYCSFELGKMFWKLPPW